MSWRRFVRMNRKRRQCHNTEDVGSYKQAISTLSGSFYEQLLLGQEFDGSLHYGIGHVHPLCGAGNGEVGICKQVIVVAFGKRWMLSWIDDDQDNDDEYDFL